MPAFVQYPTFAAAVEHAAQGSEYCVAHVRHDIVSNYLGVNEQTSKLSHPDFPTDYDSYRVWVVTEYSGWDERGIVVALQRGNEVRYYSSIVI